MGTAYSETATATLVAPDDGTYTKTWSISGTGATGLSINASTGAVTGTPTTAGVATVTYTVNDSHNTTKTGTTAITIAATRAAEVTETDK